MRFLFLLIISFNLLFSANISSLEQQYRDAKIDYLKASLKDDDQEKIVELKKIINLGKKLKKDTRPDEKKLKILTSKQLGKPISKESSKSNSTKSTQTKISNNSQNTLYSIKSVYTKNNSIIVDFNVDINQNDIKFFELKPSPLYRDVYDVNGYFKDAVKTKLTLDNVENVVIGQNQPNVLRIVISDKSNPNTSYTINKNQLIISVNDIANSAKSVKKVEETKKIVKNEVEKESASISENSNNMIDTINSIRSIESIDNKVVVKFNKAFSKKDLKYNFYKNGGNFENIFDISGKYKYVNPTKLNIDGIDKIITTQNGNKVRIRFINKINTKISYSLTKDELTIKANTTTSSTNNQTSKTKIINKTIVIDAGHGGEDVGAVGPNKRYEKVINLNIAKYLASILKQRGYKVYLTRSTDVFIKVMDRTVLANDKNADLFISIHTNSMPKEKAHTTSGIETFFLSPARSERAKKVAALENKDDIREMNESSKSAFLESLNRPRITASHKFAIDVQSGLLQAARTKYKDVKDSGVKEGPFWVLVGAQMPSILIEVGFISHPEESRRLYEKEYQQLLANGIANGVDSYFSKNP